MYRLLFVFNYVLFKLVVPNYNNYQLAYCLFIVCKCYV